MTAAESLNPYDPPRTVGPSDRDSYGVRSFKTRFLPFWLTIAGVSAVFDLIVAVMDRSSANWWLVYSVMLTATIALEAIFAAIFVAYFRVYVSPLGIRCFDFWGRYRNIAWPHIASVEPTSLLGLPYLKLHSPEENRPIWLPLFLRRPVEFWQLVLSWLPPDSPLRVHAQRHAERKA